MRGQKLDDGITTKAMQMLMYQKPELKIQPTSLSQAPGMLQRSVAPTLFIHHTGKQHHFVTSTSIGGTVRVYDSLNLSPSHSLIEQMSAIYTANGKADRVRMRQAAPSRVELKQVGSTDCGVFAIAYAVEVALGTEPREVYSIRFKQNEMRRHLVEAFDMGSISKFPRSDGDSATYRHERRRHGSWRTKRRK
jgi:hypothetical protein